MTTDSQRIEALVRELRMLGRPTPHDVARIVGEPLHKTKETSSFEFFASDKLAAPFADVTLRIKKDDSGRGLLVFHVAEDAVVAEGDLGLKALGEPSRIDANPKIPPEGTVSKTYRHDGLEVRFQLTAKAKNLRLLAFEWGLES